MQLLSDKNHVHENEHWKKIIFLSLAPKFLNPALILHAKILN